MKNKKIKKLIAAAMITSAMTAVLPAVLNSVPAYALSMTSADDVSMTSAQAHDAGFEFALVDSGSHVQITRFDTSKEGEVTIPSKIDGKPVTQIGANAFYGCQNLTSVIMPDSVESIGNDAFHDCYRLTAVIIPDSVTSIGDYAFYNCINLPAVIIPDSVTSIGAAAFWYCPRLISVTILGNGTTIGDYAFGSIGSNAEFYVPDPQVELKLHNAHTDASAKVTVYINIVTSINSIDDITVANGTAENSIGLPQYAVISLDNTTTTSAAVAVNWDDGSSVSDGTSYNGNKAGTYVFTGTFIMPHRVINPNNLKAQVNVIVEAATNDNPSNNSGSSSGHHHHDSATTDDVAAAAQGGSQAGNGSGTKTVPPDGWFQAANGWEYLKNGKPVTSWQEIKGIWYLFDASGIMQTGWKEVNGAWYLLKDNGAMATGWQMSGNKWYFMKDNGEMAKGWQQVNGIWYLLKEDGSMAIGWQEADGQWYYLYSDGAMAKNTSINGCSIGDDGAWIQ